MEYELSWDEYYAIVGTSVLKAKHDEARGYELTSSSLPRYITGLCGELAFGKLFNVYPQSLGIEFNGANADLLLGDMKVDLKTVNGLFFRDMAEDTFYMLIGKDHVDRHLTGSLNVDIYIHAVCRMRKVKLLGWNHVGVIIDKIQHDEFPLNNKGYYEVSSNALRPMMQLKDAVKGGRVHHGQEKDNSLVADGWNV
jgi:hypothetical protein